MIFHIFSTDKVNPWDDSTLEVGCGGSEMAHIHACRYLAKMGHEVVSYSPLPGSPHQAEGVEWRDASQANFQDKGIWIICRRPDVSIQPGPGRVFWLLMHDLFNQSRWDAENVKRFKRILTLSPFHMETVKRLAPANAHQVVLSGNGVDMDHVRGILAAAPSRQRHKLIWASSPDRGLGILLDIFAAAKERVPILELDIFYGLEWFEQAFKNHPDHPRAKATFAAASRAKSMRGVSWHGKVGRTTLMRAFASAGIWCYPTTFLESSCIVAMEAQALGAIPLYHPIGALQTTVRDGFAVNGDPRDPLTQQLYVEYVVRLAEGDPVFEVGRGEMMRKAESFSWASVVVEWAKWAEEDLCA